MAAFHWPDLIRPSLSFSHRRDAPIWEVIQRPPDLILLPTFHSRHPRAIAAYWYSSLPTHFDNSYSRDISIVLLLAPTIAFTSSLSLPLFPDFSSTRWSFIVGILSLLSYRIIGLPISSLRQPFATVLSAFSTSRIAQKTEGKISTAVRLSGWREDRRFTKSILQQGETATRLVSKR